ncbi:MAG: ABC transporter substrate-binding protein [Desulfotomaculaceae bacterium]|nr:ABC transporter substrate-binding protein [Desulfotomaculaceae bacterium]
MQPRIKLIRAISILASVLIFMALIAHSRNNDPEVKEVQTIRVMESVRSPYFLPLYLALNLKFFEEQDLDVKITTSSPEAIRTALNSRRIDIALCGIQKIIFNPDQSAQGEDLPKIFATMSLLDGSLLLGEQDNSEFQWSSLKDKTIIGYSQDDSSGIALESVLRANNLTPYRRVTIYHNIPEALRMSAFRSGTGHYIQLLEPEASYAEIKSYGRVVASVGATSVTMAVTAFAAMPSYINEQPESIQKFTNAVCKAQLWLNQHSAEEAVEVAYPSFKNLDRQVLINAIERYKSLKIWADNPLVPRESYEHFIAAAKEAGEIAGNVPYETAVIMDFARLATETVIYNKETEQADKKSLLRRLLP